MSWVVDSCVLLDVALKDPDHGLSSAMFLEEKRRNGLTVCPVTLIEVAPFFGGDARNVREFLELMGVDPLAGWMDADTESSAMAWSRYVQLKRGGATGRRPVADIMIGAFAARHEGLITRNPDHFRPYFPELAILEPPRVKSGVVVREKRPSYRIAKSRA